MPVLDLKKEYLTENEIKDYDASLKQISVLKKEIETKQAIIDQIRAGVEKMNREMYGRHRNFMMTR